jgi:hypothetical protein
MSADHLVVEFFRLATLCLSQLNAQFVGTERPTVYTGMWLQPREGSDAVRSGVLNDLGSFKLHGFGCGFELTTGEELDVDWRLEDGKAVFDSWRILMFATSAGVENIEREDLRLAASQNPAIEQLERDAFTWPHGRFDLI